MADQVVEWVTNDLISAARLNDYRAFSLHVQPASAGMVGLKVWGKDGGDTADLIQARSGADADLFAVEDDGALRLNGTVVFEADRDIGINLIPNAGSSKDIGNSSRRWDTAYLNFVNLGNGSIITGTDGNDIGSAAARFDLFASDVRSYSAASEANPTVRINAGGVFFGLNSADNLSVKLSAGAANRLDLATGDSFHMVSGDLTIAATFSHVTSTGKTFTSGEMEIDGALNHDGTTVGFYGVTPVTRASAYTQTYSTADKTLDAYTSDHEDVAYTGLSNTALGTVFAKVADLNLLRVAYENLRVFTEDAVAMLNAAVDDLQALGLVQ